jgi:hypothetical protein
MIVAASTTLLADSRSGGRGGFLPWILLVIGSVASLTANVAVAEPTATGRVIAAWPSFALIGAYEMLMRQVRRNATRVGSSSKQGTQSDRGSDSSRQTDDPAGIAVEQVIIGRELQRRAWYWAQAHCSSDGCLPSGREIARQFGRHERWGRLVKRSGCGGEFGSKDEPPESNPSTVNDLLSA